MKKRTPSAEVRPPALRVLGELCVERDGQRQTLPPSKKTRALLGYLLVEPREHSREQLCDLFWDAPDDPRGALRWSLSRPLLEEPGRPRLIADRERVRLEARP
jgi:DNA-binding SARP family transcriptional activator